MRKRGWIIVPTVLALVASLTAVNMITPRYKSEARILVDGRENVFLRPNGERNEERGVARRRGRDQPGATGAVARSRPRDHQEEQARRAPRIRSGAAGIFAAEIGAGAVRHRPRPALDVAGRARAGRLLRALHGLRRRQVPRHRRRIPVARSGACRARRQLDRGRLSGAAAGRAAGSGKVRRPVAVAAKSKICARRLRRPNRASRISVPSRACSSAPTTPRCPTSRWARSTRS